MSKQIIIDAGDLETRVAVLEDKRLAEISIEKRGERLLGNIYKGRVVSILPGMQAAFVDVAEERSAYLGVTDVIDRVDSGDEEMPADLKSVPIEGLLKVGQEALVQVIREPIRSKGARVTTRISLPGRYLVLIPKLNFVGISRRIENEEERERLKGLAEKIKLPDEGLIVRTISEGVGEEYLRGDIEVLRSLWEKIEEKAKRVDHPALIHQEISSIKRTLRDLFDKDTKRLIINSLAGYEDILASLSSSSPDLKEKVELYNLKENIFEHYHIEEEISQALASKAYLKCGGNLVFDYTEGLTVIDVNSGKNVGKRNLASTILKTNLEAAQKIAHQIRLRDIGGIIVIDFIDMKKEEEKEKVLQVLKEAAKGDKARTNILPLTELGLVQMTRKRVGKNLSEVLLKPCPYCQGRGRIRKDEKD